MRHTHTKTAKQIEPETVSVAVAEAMTGVSRWTWRRWCYSRRIASVKVGKRLLIPTTELRRVLAEGLRPAAERDAVIGG